MTRTEWPWHLLGLSPEASTAEIRRAYSRLLKQARPDDDPEGFQRLHSAYQAALAGIASEPVGPEAFLTAATSEPGFSAPRGEIHWAAPEPEPDDPLPMAEFLTALHEVASERPGELHAWLCGQPVLYSLRVREHISEGVLGFLASAEPLQPNALEDLLRFFGLDGVDQRTQPFLEDVQALRQRSRGAFGDSRQMEFRGNPRSGTLSPFPAALVLAGLYFVMQLAHCAAG